MTLAVYTFVFSAIFPSRWAGDAGGSLSVAINLFIGLLTFNFLAEILISAPRLITARPSFVTKVVFPLQILSVVSVLTSLFHALTSLAILLLFQLLLDHSLSWSILWLPLVWLPLLLASLALSWLLAALGVFMRDLAEVTTVLTTLLMFLSAVFYPLSSLPARVKPILAWNPIAVLIDQTRLVIVEAGRPDLIYLLLASLLAFAAAEASLRLFVRVRLGFADVL